MQRALPSATNQSVELNLLFFQVKAGLTNNQPAMNKEGIVML